MALDPQLQILQTLGRLFAESGEHVEGELRVEYVLGLSLEGKQADGLLLQLVETRLAALAGGFEHVRYRALNGVQRMQAIQDQGQGDCRRAPYHVHRVRGDAATGWVPHRGSHPSMPTLLAGV